MPKSTAVYFGAFWSEDKETPTGSMNVEKLRELVEKAESNDDEKIYFSVFPNDRKENDTQPDYNLVHYPNDEVGRKSTKKYSGSRGGGKTRSKKSGGKKRSYGSSKKSSMF